jgi:hypothetical protein
MKLRICTLLGIGTLLLAAVASLAVRADDVAKDKGAAKEKKEARSIEHARAYLALTRLDLEMAIARNRAIPNTYPRSLILLLEQQAAVAEEWLKHTETQNSTSYDYTVRSAQIYADTAAADYASAVKLNQMGAMNAQDLERMRLKAELAKLSLGWAQEIDPSSTLGIMQFHIVRLGEHVADLTRTQLELLDRN